MKIDFHTHGKLAKDLYFSEEYTYNMFNQALNSGLDAICLTEHFNTTQFDDVYKYVRDISKRDGDTLVLENGLRIFPGIEVDISEGGHILCIGEVDEILELRNELKPHIDNFLKFSDLMNIFDKYHVLVGAADPFRPGKSANIPTIDHEELKRLSFIDLNGKDLALYGEEMEKKVRDFANSLNLPLIGGSDTHQENQYGAVYNVFDREYNSIDEIYEAVLENRYEIQIHDNIVNKVETASLIKKLLKEINILGGDYAQVVLEG